MNPRSWSSAAAGAGRREVTGLIMPRRAESPGWRPSLPCSRAPGRTPSSGSRRRSGASWRGARRGRHGHRRSARARRPADRARAARRSARGSGYPLAQGLPELREAVAGWVGRRFGGAARRRAARSFRRSGRRRRSSALALALLDRDGETGAPSPTPSLRTRSYERGALFAGGEPLALPLEASRGFLPDLDAVDWDGSCSCGSTIRTTRPERCAGLDFYERAAELARAPRVRARLGRGVHGALVRRAAGLGAAARRPDERARLQQPQQAVVDDRLPLAGSPPATPSSMATLRAFRPTVGTAPQEFVQRAAVAAWGDEEHVERNARGLPRQARRAAGARSTRAGLRVAGSEATIYLWVGCRPARRRRRSRHALLDRGVVVAPGSYFGPVGRGLHADRAHAAARASAAARRRSSESL